MTQTPPDDPGAFWDEKFDRPDYRYGTKPNAFVKEQLPRLIEPGDSVLSVGDGEGRNGVWCAEQGYETTSLEPSGVGRQKIAALADERGVTVNIVDGLMTEDAVDAESFDAVILTFIHAPEKTRRQIHRACIRALRPGGVIVLEAFTPAQREKDRPSGGPPSRELLFTTDMLRDDFRPLQVEYLAEKVVELDEGEGHRGPADVVRLVARKRAVDSSDTG